MATGKNRSNFPTFGGDPDEGVKVGRRLINNITGALREDQDPTGGLASVPLGGDKAQINAVAWRVSTVQITRAIWDAGQRTSIPKNDRNFNDAKFGTYRAKFTALDRETGRWYTYGRDYPLDAGPYSDRERTGPFGEYEEGDRILAFFDPILGALVPVETPWEGTSVFDARGGESVSESTVSLTSASGSITDSMVIVEWNDPREDEWVSDRNNVIRLSEGPLTQRLHLEVRNGTRLRLRAAVVSGETYTLRSWKMQVWLTQDRFGWTQAPVDPADRPGLGSRGTIGTTPPDEEPESSSSNTQIPAGQGITPTPEDAGFETLAISEYGKTALRKRHEPSPTISENGEEVVFDMWEGVDATTAPPEPKSWTAVVTFDVDLDRTAGAGGAELQWVQAPDGGLPARVGADPSVTLCDKVVAEFTLGVPTLKKTADGAQIPVMNWQQRVMGAEGDRIVLVDKHEGATSDNPAKAINDYCRNPGDPATIVRIT